MRFLSVVVAQGEEIELTGTISTAKARGQVEKWLLELERLMKDTILMQICSAIDDYTTKAYEEWILLWPTQCVSSSTMLCFPIFDSFFYLNFSNIFYIVFFLLFFHFMLCCSAVYLYSILYILIYFLKVHTIFLMNITNAIDAALSSTNIKSSLNEISCRCENEVCIKYYNIHVRLYTFALV